MAQCPHDREPNDVCDRCRISGRIRRLVRDRCRNRLHTEGFLEGDRSCCRLAVGEGVANVRQVDPARDVSGRQGGVFIVREPDRASAKSVEELELRIRSELGFDDHDLRTYVPRGERVPDRLGGAVGDGRPEGVTSSYAQHARCRRRLVQQKLVRMRLAAETRALRRVEDQAEVVRRRVVPMGGEAPLAGV